jgi:hypothetical protein
VPGPGRCTAGGCRPGPRVGAGTWPVDHLQAQADMGAVQQIAQQLGELADVPGQGLAPGVVGELSQLRASPGVKGGPQPASEAMSRCLQVVGDERICRALPDGELDIRLEDADQRGRRGVTRVWGRGRGGRGVRSWRAPRRSVEKGHAGREEGDARRHEAPCQARSPSCWRSQGIRSETAR